MIRQEREALFVGPKITIFAGPTAVGGIFKRAAMVSSLTFNKHFAENPNCTEFRFEEGTISTCAIQYLFNEWMPKACKEFQMFVVPMLDNFGRNVALLRAARLLGMERYTKHILGVYVDYLKTELPDYEEIEIIEKSATSDKDPL